MSSGIGRGGRRGSILLPSTGIRQARPPPHDSLFRRLLGFRNSPAWSLAQAILGGTSRTTDWSSLFRRTAAAWSPGGLWRPGIEADDPGLQKDDGDGNGLMVTISRVDGWAPGKEDSNVFHGKLPQSTPVNDGGCAGG